MHKIHRFLLQSGPLTGVLGGLIYMSGLYWYCFNVIGDPKEYAQTIGTSSSGITTILMLLGGIEVVRIFLVRTVYMAIGKWRYQ